MRLSYHRKIDLCWRWFDCHLKDVYKRQTVSVPFTVKTEPSALMELLVMLAPALIVTVEKTG